MHTGTSKHYTSLYQNTAQESGKQGSLDLAAVVSGGVLFALLALFGVVLSAISYWCIKKRKQVDKRDQQWLKPCTYIGVGTMGARGHVPAQ